VLRQEQQQQQQQLQVSSTAAAVVPPQCPHHVLAGAAVGAAVCSVRVLSQGLVWLGLGKGACPLAFNLW
jgi:hypothetical protein